MVAISAKHVVFVGAVLIFQFINYCHNIHIIIKWPRCWHCLRLFARGFCSERCLRLQKFFDRNISKIDASFVIEIGILLRITSVHPSSSYHGIAAKRPLLPIDLDTRMIYPHPKEICPLLITGWLDVIDVYDNFHNIILNINMNKL